MPPIYYETDAGDVYEIDGVSQRLLVYVYLHGEARTDEVIQPVGVDNELAVRTRVENQLGPDAAGLVRITESGQKTLDGGPDSVIYHVVLTDSGEEFIQIHRSQLSMPVKIAELAKDVSELQVQVKQLLELRERVEDIEARVAEHDE